MFLPALDQYDEQIPYAVPLGISIQDMTTWVMVATLALHTAAARCMAYFGWDPADWVRIVHPVMSRWAAAIGPGVAAARRPRKRRCAAIGLQRHHGKIQTDKNGALHDT